MSRMCVENSRSFRCPVAAPGAVEGGMDKEERILAATPWGNTK